MSKITLNDVTNIDALSVINDNFDRIEQELQNKVLYRDNPAGEPNVMENSIDMNGFDILNAGQVFSAEGRWATIDELEEIEANVNTMKNTAELARDQSIVYAADAQFASIEVQTLYDSFDDRYLGVKTSDPAVDNDGSPLSTGVMYFRSSGTPIMRVFNGGTWQDVGSITTTTTTSIDPVLWASQLEAETATSETKVMNPKRVSDAINKLVKEGFTTTGAITLPGNASSALHAVPKQQLDAAISAISAVPSGSVTAFAGSSVPAGWLECDGSAVSRTTYAALFAAVGTTYGVGDGSTTFNLPQLRGEFIRGWDNGRGIDSGRARGSAQLDAFQGHEHRFYDIKNGGGGGYNGAGAIDWTRTTYEVVKKSDTFGEPRIAPETRPRNIAMYYIIKT